MATLLAIDQLQAQLGASLRALRIEQNLDQQTVAERAAISLRAVKNLESGNGSTTKSLIAYLRVFGREDWLATIAPVATINPLNMTQAAKPRQRASFVRKPKATT